ncbi:MULTISPECIES: hypothetical protein [Pseudofrankia]|uniref:hypothetical protein n=1 Tax=Pseudofrankia TaxID=2994363 RepID=UPI000234DBEE|nr:MULTISPECIES: hypothetical protein [Pseudofrankia]OHV36924.1 hypothetical protein BCD49_16730 [Pseudofrankia sp. EUN1h]
MSDDPTVGFLKADVARFCAGLDDLAPAIRLRLVVELRRALDEVTDTALDSGMAAARAEGWGLRQIGGLVGLSHEKVRYRLARAAGEPAGSS